MKVIKRNRNTWPFLFNDAFAHDFFNLHPSTYGRTAAPAVNVKENEEAFELEVAIPGINKDDVKVELKHDLLTISFEEKHENTNEGTDGGYTRKEFGYRSFSRAFRLPETIDGANIHAKYEDGILKIGLPKTEKAKDENRLISIS